MVTLNLGGRMIGPGLDMAREISLCQTKLNCETQFNPSTIEQLLSARLCAKFYGYRDEKATVSSLKEHMSSWWGICVKIEVLFPGDSGKNTKNCWFLDSEEEERLTEGERN